MSSTRSRKPPPERKVGGAPLKEWGTVAFVLVGAAVLIGSAAFACDTAREWLAFGTAVVGAALIPLVYTLKLHHEGRLYLRNEAEIEANRSRIQRVSIPLGWTLAAVLLLISFVFSTAVYAVMGGLLLGLFPGILANFLRLRREVWR